MSPGSTHLILSKGRKQFQGKNPRGEVRTAVDLAWVIGRCSQKSISSVMENTMESLVSSEEADLKMYPTSIPPSASAPSRLHFDFTSLFNSLHSTFILFYTCVYITIHHVILPLHSPTLHNPMPPPAPPTYLPLLLRSPRKHLLRPRRTLKQPRNPTLQ